MEIDRKHAFSVKKAHEAQLRLSRKIIQENRLPEKLRLVAGVDVAYFKGQSIGAVAALDFNSLETVEIQVAVCQTCFPYLSTLLSFREIPPATACIKKLQVQPDCFLVDGQGLAHPYRCGFASHLGVVLGRPTIGVAKSRLFGKAQTARMGESVSFLANGEGIVGAEVTTKCGAKPVYVSVGHLVSLAKAIEIVKACVCGNRIPEPLLKAHEIAAAEKRKLLIRLSRNE